MSDIYVIVDSRTGKPATPNGFGSRGLYAYDTKGKAAGVAKQVGHRDAIIVRYVPAPDEQS